MSRCVWKFTVCLMAQPTTISHPGSKGDVLHVAAPTDELVDFWVEVNDGDPREVRRTFAVFGTGHEVPVNWNHCASAISPRGFVWHLYEHPFPEVLDLLDEVEQ